MVARKQDKAQKEKDEKEREKQKQKEKQFWLEDSHEKREFDEKAEKEWRQQQRMSQVQIQMAEGKDDQLKGLMRQFRKDKCLKDKSIDEIRKIALTYQRLDNEARKGQQQERIRRDMGISIPKKDILRE